MSTGSAGEPSRALLRALIGLLRPLVRLLLSNHVTYPILSNLLKSVYVDVAEQHFPVSGKTQTDSRISLLTGVHRKDVKRLRSLPAEAHDAPGNVSLGSQLVALWTGLPEYRDGAGNPRPLPRLASAGEGLSFETLVASVSKDIRPRVVLDEWTRLGVAKVDEQDQVWLNVEAYIPEKGFDEKAYFFGRNVHDHIAACERNLDGGGPPFFERSVYYDELSPDSVEELRDLSTRIGMNTLQAINERAIGLQGRDRGLVGDDHRRMNFGIYFYEETTDGEP